MTLREKQSSFVWMLGSLLGQFASNGDAVVILEMYRSQETQLQYVRRGVSKTLLSKHLQGLAVDIAFLSDIQDDGVINYDAEKYRPYGQYWERLGGVWGGRFGDDPNTAKIEGWDLGHFEFKDPA